MAEPSRPQPRVFTIFDVLALVGAAGLFVAFLMPAVATRSPVVAGVAVIIGLLLVPVFFVAAWYAMIFVIVATLWLFSVDRDYPTNDPIFPPRWWDFRPLLVIGAAGGLWLAYGLPLLGRLRWDDRDDWPTVIILANVLPVGIIVVAARRWWPAWLFPPAGPPGTVGPTAPGGPALDGADADPPPPG